MKTQKGDILICSTNKIYGLEQNIIVGDKYKVLDTIEMSEKVILDLLHVDTNSRVGLFDDKCFIPLEIYREFQLRKILGNV
jgi:hypothetical protein